MAYEYIKDLIEFDTATGKKSVVFIAGNEKAKLRAKLIAEEAQELIDALYDEREEDVLKEICDVLYVVFGTVVAYDLPVEKAFEEVHKNNMLKTNYPTVDGKYVKPVDHPKVNLSKIIQQYRDDMGM